MGFLFTVFGISGGGGGLCGFLFGISFFCFILFVYVCMCGLLTAPFRFGSFYGFMFEVLRKEENWIEQGLRRGRVWVLRV